MKHTIYRILFISILSIATACTIGSKPAMPVSHDLGPIGILGADTVPLTLSAPVWLWNKRLRYRLLYKDATAIHYYNLDRWEAPLPALLERKLKVTGKQQAIKLQIQLTQFEQQFETINNANVVMSFTVSAFLGDSNRLLAKRSFALSHQAVSADAEGAIAGFVVLTEQANKDISVWLESVSDSGH